MYVYACVYVYVCMYMILTNVCLYTSLYITHRTGLHIVCINACMYVCAHVCNYMCVGMLACMYMCVTHTNVIMSVYEFGYCINVTCTNLLYK